MKKANFLFKKISDINILERAWHLARSDSKRNFILDVYRNEDFAFNIRENLKSISEALIREEYHPNPLLKIDVPKSTFAVRPGSAISIEDQIILFAITLLIAPKLDKKLPKEVYSYRLKEKFDNNSLFKDIEFLELPFLKEKTIKREIVIFEPWYGQYPKYIEDSKHVFEEEGYNFLTLSDITSYFENINLSLLHDTLINYLPSEHKIINLLCSILKYWTWPTVHGFELDRGIPQGNEVSSFLGNIYLLPLDYELSFFCKKYNAKYFRYMDDVKIFSKQESVAREAIFVLNNMLRKLHLNIQGNKTTVLKNEEIKKELYDARLDRVNEVIENINTKKKGLSRDEREKYYHQLRSEYKNIKGKKRLIKNKELRLYKRIITGFLLLNKPYALDSLLAQLPKNPDSGLTRKAVVYFRFNPRSYSLLSKKLIIFLRSPINLFSYQEANIISVFKYFNEIESPILNYCKKQLNAKNKNWYVKVQSAYLISCVKNNKRSLISLLKTYKDEDNIEVKRALIPCLCQLDKENLKIVLRELISDNNKRLYSVGRMLSFLYWNYSNRAFDEINKIFRDYNDDILMDSFYKIEIIKHSKNEEIKKLLKKCLHKANRKVRKKHLLEKIISTLDFLNLQIP